MKCGRTQCESGMDAELAPIIKAWGCVAPGQGQGDPIEVTAGLYVCRDCAPKLGPGDVLAPRFWDDMDVSLQAAGHVSIDRSSMQIDWLPFAEMPQEWQERIYKDLGGDG